MQIEAKARNIALDSRFTAILHLASCRLPMVPATESEMPALPLNVMSHRCDECVNATVDCDLCIALFVSVHVCAAASSGATSPSVGPPQSPELIL